MIGDIVHSQVENRVIIGYSSGKIDTRVIRGYSSS